MVAYIHPIRDTIRSRILTKAVTVFEKARQPLSRISRADVGHFMIIHIAGEKTYKASRSDEGRLSIDFHQKDPGIGQRFDK